MRRRAFIASGMLALTGAGARRSQARPTLDSGERARVFLARDSSYSRIGDRPDEKLAGEMIERLVRELTGQPTIRDAWRGLLGEPGSVGLKPNCLAGRGVSSSPEFVHALAGSLVDNLPGLGRVHIWERSNRDLTGAGFEISDRGRVQCRGNDSAGYGRDLVVRGSIGSLVSSFVTVRCDVLINLPVLKDHGIVGLSVGLKNYYGAVHNPNKYHLDRGDPYVADLNSIPQLQRKTRLTLCEAFTAQYEGGPPYKPQWSWPAGLVMASTDPVAMDRVGWEMVERRRAENGMVTLAEAGREPSYICTAADNDHRLGVADLSRIEQIELV